MTNESLNMDFYARNRSELEKLRTQYDCNCQQIVSNLVKSISLAFGEENGWVVYTTDRYIQLYKSKWDQKKYYGKRGAICYEIGMFDCDGQLGLWNNSAQLCVSVFVASSNLSQDIGCDFVNNSTQSIDKIVGILREFDKKFTDKIDMAMK